MLSITDGALIYAWRFHEISPEVAAVTFLSNGVLVGFVMSFAVFSCKQPSQRFLSLVSGSSQQARVNAVQNFPNAASYA